MSKIIAEFPDYSASADGSVYSNKFGKRRKMKPIRHKQGYLRVNLWNKGEKKIFMVHRIIASLFVENLLNKNEVNHINYIKSDNRADNLEWVTRQENVDHAVGNNLQKPFAGETRGCCKLTNSDVINIRQNQEKLTHAQRAAALGVSKSTVEKIARSVLWRHL